MVIGVLVYLLTQVTKCHQVPVVSEICSPVHCHVLIVVLLVCVQDRLSLESMCEASIPSVLALLTICTVSLPSLGNSNPGSQACEEGAFC